MSLLAPYVALMSHVKLGSATAPPRRDTCGRCSMRWSCNG